MATLTPVRYFRTPDKRSQPDTNTKTFSSPISKPFVYRGSKNASPTVISPSQYRVQNVEDRRNQQELLWYQERTDELRKYLDESIHIDKNRIRYIFGWEKERNPSEEIEQKILKDLSSKVKALIKENADLRVYSHTEQIAILKGENMALQGVIDQFQRGEAARESILSEENRYLREYIHHRREDNEKLKNIKDSVTDDLIESKQSNKEVIAKPGEDFSSHESVSKLRKYLMTYVNTVIEANDQKMQAQQKYLDSLEQRVAQLNKFQDVFEHLKFQKTVTLQESNRKSKNFSIGVPKIEGQRFQYQPEASPKESQQSKLKNRFFISNSLKQDGTNRSNKEVVALVLRSAQLQEQLSTLQQKYQLQIQNHIRYSSDREELITNIQKLSAEKKDLKFQVYQLEQRLKISQKKVSALESSVGKSQSEWEPLFTFAGFSIQKQLSEIKKELRTCGIEQFEVVSNQILQILKQRDDLRKSLSTMQQNLAQNYKFSSAHKQIFLLTQKNKQLQQTCRFYEQQIGEYEKQLRVASEQSECRLAKDISGDFKDMEKSRDFQGLKWPQLAHTCMVNSIARLQNIEKQLHLASHP